ncbi:MAG: hypothetical protein AABZ55_08555, partial [Bdellovibrionota bacterium]
AYSAERKVERLKIEVAFETTTVKKAVLEKEVQLLIMQKEGVEREHADVLKQIKEHENRVLIAQNKLQDAESKITLAAGKFFDLKSNIDSAKKELNEVEAKKQSVIQKIQNFEDELKSRKENFELDEANTRTQIESELTELRNRTESEITQMRTQEIQSLKLRSDQEDKKIHAYYLEQIKHMDAKVAQRRLEEEKKLDRLQDQSEFFIKQRRKETAAAASAQARMILRELFTKFSFQGDSTDILNGFELEVSEAVLAALDPDHTQSKTEKIRTNESNKAKHFWVKLGGGVATVAVAGITLAIFPQLPKSVARNIYRAISSNKSDNVFMEEIHRKGEKFNPPTSRNYKATYTDNILYTEGYLAMKTDNEIKKKWTLALNDFFIGTLGVGDRAIVDFVAAEAVLIGEIAATADLTSIQFKEVGIKKMQDTEAHNLPRLENLVGGKEGYTKFRNFERAFYEANRK